MDGETFLPPEIITEILSMLDVKSLLVVKCVCKLWCSIIEEQHFVQMHMRRSKVTYAREEILYEDGDKDFQLLCIRNGLLLEKHQTKNTLRVRNPATKIKLCLPDPSHKLVTVTNLLHLPTTDNYKVVSVFGKERNEFGGCQVLTLGIDSAWRALEIPILHHLNGQQLHNLLSASTDDVAYIMWFSHVDANVDNKVARDIVCIEIETEDFVTLRAPETLFASWDDVWPQAWEDKLSLYKTVGQELHVWVLEDYKNQKWADRKITISLSFLSKHASISTNLYPGNLTNGWLYIFDNHGIFRIAYHVESGMECILDDHPSENIRLKFTLVNPYKAPRMPLLPTQPTQPIRNRNYSLSSPFIGILNLLGGLCMFPKDKSF